MTIRATDRTVTPVQPNVTSDANVRSTVTQTRAAQSIDHDVFDPAKAFGPRTLLASPAARAVDGANLEALVDAEPPANTEDALQAIDELLIGAPVNEDPDGAGDGQGTVETDPDDVNASNPFDDARARAQVEANAELEAAELEKLSPEEREQYLAVKAELEAQDDPKSVLALQKLLFEGRLPGAEDLEGGGTLLDNLATLADPNTPLAEGIDRGELLADVVHEVAVPSATAQGNRGTCAATSVAIHLMRDNPAEYVRLMTGLASPEGEVKLANGDTIRREDGTIGDDGSTRSLAQRLIEPAFMEYANGDDLDYRNDLNGSYDEDGDRKQGGLYSDQVDRLLQGVFDRKFDNHDGINTDGEREEAWDELVDEVEGEGRDVEVGLHWGDGGHKVLVTDISTDENGEEYVTYINPWGKTETLPKDEFLARLKNMNTEADGFFSEIDIPFIDDLSAPQPPSLEQELWTRRRQPIAA